MTLIRGLLSKTLSQSIMSSSRDCRYSWNEHALGINLHARCQQIRRLTTESIHIIMILINAECPFQFDAYRKSSGVIKARRILLSARLFIEFLFGPVDDLETGFNRNRF